MEKNYNFSLALAINYLSKAHADELSAFTSLSNVLPRPMYLQLRKLVVGSTEKAIGLLQDFASSANVGEAVDEQKL